VNDAAIEGARTIYTVDSPPPSDRELNSSAVLFFQLGGRGWGGELNAGFSTVSSASDRVASHKLLLTTLSGGHGA